MDLVFQVRPSSTTRHLEAGLCSTVQLLENPLWRRKRVKPEPWTASLQCLLARRLGGGGASEAGARTSPQFGAALRRSACRNPRDAERRFLLPDSLWAVRWARPRTGPQTHRRLLRVTARRKGLRNYSCAFERANVRLERWTTACRGPSARRQGWAYVVKQSRSDLPLRA